MAGLQIDDNITAGLHEAKLHDSEIDQKITVHSASEVNSLHDGIHDGLVFPTTEELATLRRVPDTIPWAAYRAYIILLG